ncbi:MAG TPA: redoxin domain-containing protein [Tepidisphaeraceae bacterium]|jgi:mono/diheme cytochrome c family protein/thiol-disulfide isomerase/thioredoxin
MDPRRNLTAVFLIGLMAAALSAAETISPQRVLDCDGQPRTTLRPGARATVIVFLGTQCPVSNRYIPLLNDLGRSHQKDGVDLLAIVSDPTVSFKDLAKYRDEYKIEFPVVLDTSGALAKQFAPTVTPESFLIDADGQLAYRGEIDDLFVAVGKQNQVVKSRDLADALSAVLSHEPVKVPQTKAVGCIFEAWNAKDRPASVTYSRDIAPILNANCASCHRAGEIAPFPLDNYTDAAKHAKQLAAVTESHYMPPWKPAANFGHFVGEHRLPDEQIKLIDTWAEAGAPEGDVKDLPPAPKFSSGWTLGEPDLVVKMHELFTVPASGPDVYRAFVAPLNLPDDTYVAGIEFRPGAKTVVHHCLLFLDNTGTARKLDEEDPAPGYRSFGGPGFTPTGSLGGWAPGASQPLLPEGVGRFVAAKSDLVFQMHYHPDGRQREDQSSVAIYLQKKPVKKVISSIPLATRDIDIAAGDSNYVRNVKFNLPQDLLVSGVIPHMHLIGRDMKVFATTPDGKQLPLIWIDDWDFKWQGQYRFVEPITVPKGSTLELTARYDNSESNPNNPNNPPKRVKRGEQTTDEMCICFVEFEADSQQAAMELRRAVLREAVGDAIRRRVGGASPEK